MSKVVDLGHFVVVAQVVRHEPRVDELRKVLSAPCPVYLR